jgi:hypothetical protein
MNNIAVMFLLALPAMLVGYPKDQWAWLPNTAPETPDRDVDLDAEPELEIDPQIVFREEATMAASMSFGHLSIRINVVEAESLAHKISSLLNDAKSIFAAKPFGGNDEQTRLGGAWSESLWNRTKARFLTSQARYTDTITMFYKGIDDATRPEELLHPREASAKKPIRLAGLHHTDSPPVTAKTSFAPDILSSHPHINDKSSFKEVDSMTQDSPAGIKPHDRQSLNSFVTQFSDFSFAEAVQEPNRTLIRSKRFVVSTGAIVIGGIFAIIGGIAVNNAVQISGIDAGDVSAEQAEFVINSLQNHEEMIAKLKDDLEVAKDEIAEMKLRGFQNHIAILAMLHNLRASEIANSVIDEYDRVTRELQQGLRMLMDGKLDSNLVPPNALVTLVDRMKDKAEKAGLFLPISDVAEVYGLGCSFVASSPRHLTIIVHLPLTKPNAVMTVYKFLNLGYAMLGSNNSVSVAVEAPLLAVNSERTGFLMLSSLDPCIRLGSLRMCQGYNFQLKSFEKYCISSLFLSRKPEAEKTCTTNVLPDQARVIQDTRTSYYVFHPSEATLAIDQCENATFNRRETFRGTRLIELQKGCFGHNRDYQLNPLEELGLKLSTVKFTNTLSLPKLLKGMTVRTLNELFPVPPRKETSVPDLLRQYDALPKASNPYSFSWPFHFPALLTSSFSFFVIIAIIVGLCCFRHKLAMCLIGKKSGRTQDINVNVGGPSTSQGTSETPMQAFMSCAEDPDQRRGRRSSFSGSIHNIAHETVARSQNALGNIKDGISQYALGKWRSRLGRAKAVPQDDPGMLGSYESENERYSPPRL